MSFCGSIGRKQVCLSAAIVLLTIFPGALPAQQRQGTASDETIEALRVRFARELSRWYQYGAALRAGKIENAGQALQSLEATLQTDRDRTDFWKCALPEDHRRAVRFMRVCDVCEDGSCPLCHGGGVCPNCKGDRKCKMCRGVGELREACTKCLCSDCGGTGFCPKCQSRGTIACAACSGRGFSVEDEASPCKKCKGVGKLAGGLKGDVMRPCPACEGKGTLHTSKRVDCQECLGKGARPCSVCNGTGFCQNCRGKKRTGGCSVCNDTGTVSAKCSRCSGTGKCTDCATRPICVKCEGRGLCTVCGGAKVLTIASMPADSTWLNFTNACMMQSAAYFSVNGQPAEAVRKNVAYGVLDTNGLKKLSYGKVPLKLSVGRGEVLCISDGINAGWVSGTLFRVSY